MSEVANILITDDHQMFIDGLKILIGKNPNYNVIAEAQNGVEALERIKQGGIDVLITDISMPEMDGVELTKKVKQEFPEIKILVLSMYNDRETVGEILMAEADGYILKNTGKEELTTALDKICNNSTYYSNEILSIMMEQMIAKQKQEEETKNLTEREVEVLKLIAQEFSSEEIAEKLFISKRTVDSHRQNIIEKTKVKTIVGLIKYAIRNGLA